MQNLKKIYLDYAATTPVDPAVFRAMMPYFSERFGNPGSLHSFGQEAIAAVDRSREIIAKSIGAEFREIIFTSSATEANNLALRGVVRHGKWQMALRRGSGQANGKSENAVRPPRIIVSAIEHESVLETARDLEKEGIDVVYLPVDRHGLVDLEKLKESLTSATVLVSIMHANNEIGTIQPIAEIAKIVRDFRNQKPQIPSTKSQINPNYQITQLPNHPLFHSDCSQSFQFLDCNVKNLGVDLMTLSAHKMYGPKGAGALYLATSHWPIANRYSGKTLNPTPHALLPLFAGGGQEFGFRSGTENVPAIVGFAKAVELIFSRSEERENMRIENLRDQLWKGIKKICPTAELNGVAVTASSSKFRNPEISKPSVSKSLISRFRDFEISGHLPNILNVHFPDHDAQDLLTRLDLHGLAVSSGSACRSRAMESSYVIQALGYSKDRAKSSIRFSLGRPTTKKEIDAALKTMGEILSV